MNTRKRGDLEHLTVVYAYYDQREEIESCVTKKDDYVYDHISKELIAENVIDYRWYAS